MPDMVECEVDCQPEVVFFNNYKVEGIIIDYLDTYTHYLIKPSVLSLTDITLRFRSVLLCGQGFGFPRIPIVYLMPPSNYECESDKIKCNMDNVCYSSHNYCLHCMAMSLEDCACRNSQGFIDVDGIDCEFSFCETSYYGT